MSLRALRLLGTLAHAACAPEEALTPAPFSPSMRKAVDLDPDPSVVEVSLVAEPGDFAWSPEHHSAVWAYRDASVPDSPVTVPGPMIEARVGDRLIVHFCNGLEEGTTIHHHGPRMPFAMDGVPMGDGMVLPGECFDYDFVLHDAGTFWYHPHWNTDEQIERGLYGQLLVHGKEIAGTTDRAFMLDDADFASDGSLILELAPLDYLLGRHGKTLLVNGRPTPIQAVTAGARERWRFTNASNGRYYALSLAGHHFTVIASDGGLLADPYPSDELFLAPADRLEVLVELEGGLGDELELITRHVPRGMGEPVEADRVVMKFRIDAVSNAPPLPVESVLPQRVITPLPVDADTPVEVFELEFDLEPLPGAPPAFSINDERWPFVSPIQRKVGDLAIWEIVNQTPTPEPFHLHGTFFQVLDRDGVPEPRLSLEDVVNVEAGSTLRFAVRYERPGSWMFHSHIPEHAQLGMMRVLTLE